LVVALDLAGGVGYQFGIKHFSPGFHFAHFLQDPTAAGW
jgi:hypothetical protein